MNRKIKRDLREEYYMYLYDIIAKDIFAPKISVHDLLRYLHETEFRYTIYKDKNRYNDGLDLRYRFVIDREYEYIEDDVLGVLDGSCSVLEMMIALALRMEETIMDDTRYGNRTKHWFWHMITNMGLGGQWNELFDREYVEETVNRFLDRKYEKNGKGGLFTIRHEHTDKDLRKVEIWYQMNWYLNSIT